MRRVLKKVFHKTDARADASAAVEDDEADDLNADERAGGNSFVSYSVDSYAPSVVCSPLPKAPGPASHQQPELFKSAAEVAGAPCATPPAIYQTHVPHPPASMVAPAAGAGAGAGPGSGLTEAQLAAQQSLPSPPRDHVAPKAYESVTISMGRNCPPGLRRQTWHVTDFDLRKLMYNGAISMVYHAVDKRSGITVALKLYKRIKLNEIERHQVAREIRLHADLCHDSIIAMYGAWKDRAYVYLALEWAPGGDVYSYLKSQRGRLAEELAVPLILEPFMAGLSVIHDKGLIHRDIKPENMLLTNSFQVKIADFGLSIDSKQEIANTRLGTIDYLAPEILDCPVKQHPEDHKDRPDIGYTNKVDCWSVGVLAYELLVGQPPFAAPSAQETLRLIRTKKVEYPNWLSADSVHFISSVLVRDPTLRPTIAELLQHPWILKYSRREGGGLARSRNRLLRRPTVDGGMLVRSNTADLAPIMAAQQKQQLAQQQQQQQAAAAAAAAAGGPAGLQQMQQQLQAHQAHPPTGQHPHPHHAGHTLQHSHTYGHGSGLTQAQAHMYGGGGGSGGSGALAQLSNPQSQPLPLINGGHSPLYGTTHGNVGVNGNGPPLAVAPAPVTYDAFSGGAAMAMPYSVALPGGGGAVGPGTVPLPLPPHLAPSPGSPSGGGGGVEKSPGSGSSMARKLKFWSTAAPGSASPTAGLGGATGLAMPPAATAGLSVALPGAGTAGTAAAWGDVPHNGAALTSLNSPNSSKLGPLPPVHANGAASPANTSSPPSLFARLTSAKSKTSIGGGSSSGPVQPPAPPTPMVSGVAVLAPMVAPGSPRCASPLAPNSPRSNKVLHNALGGEMQVESSTRSVKGNSFLRNLMQ